MSSKPVKTVGKTVLKRVSGLQIGLIQAPVAAAIVGAGAAVLTYRLLRSGS